MDIKHPAINKLREMQRLTEEQIDLVSKEKEKSGLPLGYLLIRFGLMNFSEWYDLLFNEFKVNTIDLDTVNIEKEIILSLPEFTCRKYQVLPVFKDSKKIICAMVDPLDREVIIQISKIAGMDIEARLIKEPDLKKNIDKYFSQVAFPDTKGVNGKILTPLEMNVSTETTAENAFIAMVSQSIELKATDIHLETEEEKLRLRYRINGVLYEFPPPYVELYSPIVSHIKVLANLDIAEKRVPQDGYVKLRIKDRFVDLRVSTYPMSFGEIVALRVLDKKNILAGLELLGFSPETLHRWRMLLDEPYGMLLVTGPTGSGKTTTLYSSLMEIDNVHKKIITLEDPIEFHIENIDQVQINPKTGLTFEVALRSILRQDPNVIMVGEIRDPQTVATAIRAAQTGQMVLATLHTNTAPGAITRLLDMGVEPYMIASSIIGVLSQRLVRTICPDCKEEYSPADEEIKELGLQGRPGIKFYRGAGCHKCKGTGYTGRVVLSELMVLNEVLRAMIMHNPALSDLKTGAMKFGMKTLRMDGIQKVLDGITTSSDVMYATRKEDE
ncbi:MAG: GspE/PulE family protein [Candidatus Omnitrophica bacterium]|nr:GspE/PulE family protein [Candidatus Omnitrophota bacterium]